MEFFLILYILILLSIFIFSIYCLILFVKLARRGIKAFDIYIKKNDDNLNNNNSRF